MAKDPVKVFILGGGLGYRELFSEEGWEVVDKFKDADLIQFTGGPDVHPSFYGEVPHKTTASDIRRDRKEQHYYNMSIIYGKQMVGICRGAQFLNVMNGGKLWQNVNGHAIKGTHEVRDVYTGECFQVTSTHHQMMRMGDRGVLLAYATETSWKERCPHGKADPLIIMGKAAGEIDPEVVWYKETSCLCFQPHPEFKGHDSLKRRYLEYITTYLYPNEEKENAA